MPRLRMRPLPEWASEWAAADIPFPGPLAMTPLAKAIGGTAAKRLPKVGEFIEFMVRGGKRVRGKVRDIDEFAKEAWVFPADRSVITPENMIDEVSMRISFSDIIGF